MLQASNVSCQWFICFHHVVRASVEKFRFVEEQLKAVWKVSDWDVSFLCADSPAYDSVIIIMTTRNEGNVYVAVLVFSCGVWMDAGVPWLINFSGCLTLPRLNNPLLRAIPYSK